MSAVFQQSFTGVSAVWCSTNIRIHPLEHVSVDQNQGSQSNLSAYWNVLIRTACQSKLLTCNIEISADTAMHLPRFRGVLFSLEYSLSLVFLVCTQQRDCTMTGHQTTISVCSVDSFREATESGEGSPQRHPVQSATHDPRQKVPPQDIQVGVFSQLQLCAMFTGIHHYKKKIVRVLQTVLCRHGAGGLVGATECLCSYPVSRCWHVADTIRRRGAQSW